MAGGHAVEHGGDRPVRPGEGELLLPVEAGPALIQVQRALVPAGDPPESEASRIVLFPPLSARNCRPVGGYLPRRSSVGGRPPLSARPGRLSGSKGLHMEPSEAGQVLAARRKRSPSDFAATRNPVVSR